MKTETPPLNTRELLLRAGRKVFSEKGLEGTTVKELADAAGVNVSLVSYYFNGKEGLYKACLESFGEQRLQVAHRVLKNPESAEDMKARLSLWMEEFIRCHIEEEEITAIIHREFNSTRKEIREIFRHTFVKILEQIEQFFSAGQKLGLIRQDVDPFVIAQLFYSALIHVARTDRVNEVLYGQTIRDSKYCKTLIENTTKIFITGLMVKVT